MDGPAMIGDPGGHGRRPLDTPHAGRRCGEAQTGMVRTEVVDAADQIPPLPQRQRMTHERSTATCQRRQALPERGLEPLDVGCVDHPVPCERRLSVSTRAGVPSTIRRSTSTTRPCT